MNEASNIYSSGAKENEFLKYNQSYIDKNLTMDIENNQNELLMNNKIHFMSNNLIGIPVESKNIGKIFF